MAQHHPTDPDFVREHSERLARMEAMLERIEGNVAAVKEQTIRTNGRVTDLEKRVNVLDRIATRNRILITIGWSVGSALLSAYGTLLVMHVLPVK